MKKDMLNNVKECDRILKKGILPSSFLNAETRSGFPVTVKDKKIWLIMLDLVLEFDKICKKHNLTYFLHYGSLLGAVRHKGFIPWDSNFDICMPRKDYEKFITLKDEFEYPYFLQTPYTDKGYYYTYCKLRNSNTAAIDFNFFYQGLNMGIFIDIFAIDNMDINNGKELYLKLKNLSIDNSTAMRLTHRRPTPANIERIKNYNGGDPFARLEYINKFWRQYENQDMPYVSLNITYYDFEHNVYPKEYFSGAIYLDFEGIKLPAPIEYKKVLKTIYGENYMEIPHKDPSYRVGQKTFLYDPDRSYTTYTEDEVFPIENG